MTTNAEKLLSILKSNGATHEDKCCELLFDRPKFDKENSAAYWQWEVDCSGYSREYFMGNDKFQTFTPTKGYEGYKGTYRNLLSEAYQELRKLGLAGEMNNGYNCYTFFAK